MFLNLRQIKKLVFLKIRKNKMQLYKRCRERIILEEETNFHLEEQTDEMEEFKAFEKRSSPSKDYKEYNPNDFLEDNFDSDY